MSSYFDYFTNLNSNPPLRILRFFIFILQQAERLPTLFLVVFILNFLIQNLFNHVLQRDNP